MAIDYTIPGTYVTINDGNLTLNEATDNPNVFLLGSAAAGPAYFPFRIGSYQQARGAVFGGEGDLVDGLHLLETTGSPS